MWLILIGVILIGAAIYIYSKQNHRQTAPSLSMRPTPIASPSALPFYGIGVILCLVAFWLFYNASYQQGWQAFSYFVFSIVLFVGSIKSFKSAYSADKKHAEDMQARADTHKSRVEFEKHDVALGTVRDEAERDAMMRRMQQELELLRMEVQKRMIPIEEQTQFMQQYLTQREMALRAQYLKPASERGISVDQYMAINEHWDRRVIDLEIKQREIDQTLQAALNSEEEVVRNQINKRLLDHAEDLMNQYANLKSAASHGNDDNADALLDLYGGYIKSLVGEYQRQGIVTADNAKYLKKFANSHKETLQLQTSIPKDAITLSRERWEAIEKELDKKYGRS